MTFGDSEGKDSDQGQKGWNFCQYHGMFGHFTDQSNSLKELVKQAKQKMNKLFDKKKRFTKYVVNVMVQKQVKKVLK